MKHITFLPWKLSQKNLGIKRGASRSAAIPIRIWYVVAGMGGQQLHDIPSTMCQREFSLPFPESRILNPESTSFPIYHTPHTSLAPLFSAAFPLSAHNSFVFRNIPA
jgi:hypothetical protein